MRLCWLFVHKLVCNTSIILLYLYIIIISIEDTNIIKNIEMWSCQWQLKINPDKSILLHVGITPQDRSKYTICGKDILPSGTVRDLGILYDDNLCFYEYFDDIVAKAFQRVNFLFRSFISGNASILVKAYITFVRPLLEYCTYVWSPVQLYLIQKLERVQKYFTWRLLPYLARLDTLKLESLEIRRIKFDLKLCYKIMNGLWCLDRDKFFTLAPPSNSRGHDFKLTKAFCKTNPSFHFFFQIELSYIGIHCHSKLSMLNHWTFSSRNWIKLILPNLV